MGGPTEQVRSAAKRRTQARLASVAITHLQKASGEISAGKGIIRTMRQRMSIGIGGGGIFAVLNQHTSKRHPDFRTPRRSIAGR